MRTKKRIIVSSVLYFLIAILIAALAVGNSYAMSYKSIISIYLNQPTSKVVNVNSENQNTDYYKSSFSSKKELLKYQTALAEEIQAEGSVLLKNDDNVLPLKKSAKVTLFGVRSVDFLSSGGGSGAIDTKGMPTLKEAFTKENYDVNPVIWSCYESGSAKSWRGSESDVNEFPASSFSAGEIASLGQYSDAAIVVIGRTGTESSDLSRTQNFRTDRTGKPLDDKDNNPNKHILEFSDNELALISFAKQHFGDNVVVVLNTMNVMELGAIDDLGVKSCIWVGAGGQKGINAIPKILNGTMYPSGRLADTYAYDLLDNPASNNFGKISFTNDNKSNLVVYGEGIYVGYRYYETRYEDKVLAKTNVGDFNYSEEVQYPFGYGLSYTTFEYSNYSLKEVGDTFEASVTVKNTGKSAGKEVVSVYMQSPYTEYDIANGIEKSAVQLVGFTKTKELKAGASETVKVVIDKEVMKAYDSKNAKTYIVDDGTYYFAVGADSHDALNNILAKKGNTKEDNGMTENGAANLVATRVIKTLDKTTYAKADNGNEITNQLSNVALEHYGINYTYLSRNNWTGTYPKTVSIEKTADMTKDADMMNAYEEDPNATLPTTGTISEKYGKLTLASLMEAEFDENEYWDALLDVMTAKELYDLSRMGGYSTLAIESIAKPTTVDKDGPAGISSTLVGGVGCFGYPIETVIAATYNVELAEKMGEYVGEDGLYSNTHGWYSPAMNIHRSAFSGRNFEYYSEDGFLSGMMGSATVKGAQSKGVYAYIKHFAFNEQETSRSGLFTFGQEQALREIYLLPFEMSVKDGGALAMMASMNRAGCVWTGAHKGLMTNILRNEWGFKGFVITDQASMGGDGHYLNLQAALYAGTDMMLNTGANNWQIADYASNKTVMTQLRTSAKRILYTVSRSHAMNGISSTSKVVKIMPTWQKWMITVDVIIGVAACLGVAYITIKLIKPDFKLFKGKTKEQKK